MSIKLDWDSVKRDAIRLSYQGQWTAQEFREQALRAFSLIRQQPRKVYGIMDFRATMWLPPTILPVLREILPQAPSNTAEMIAIGLPLPVMMSLKQLRSWYGNTQVLSAKSLEEARQLIKNLRASSTDNRLDNTKVQTQDSRLLQQIQASKAITLTTFQRTGEPVITPIYSVYTKLEGETNLFGVSTVSSGHVKRIQHNPYVWVAPYPAKVGRYLRGQACIKSNLWQQQSIVEARWLMKHGAIGWSSRFISSVMKGQQVWLRIILNNKI